jgi:hypothetical protein
MERQPRTEGVIQYERTITTILSTASISRSTTLWVHPQHSLTGSSDRTRTATHPLDCVACCTE